MSLLIGDDYPEGVEPQDRETPAPAGGLRGRPDPRGKRHDWVPWRGRRPRSMLIQDAPDLAEDGAGDEYVAEDCEALDYEAVDGDGAGPPYPGNGFLLDAGAVPDGYPQDGYLQDGYLQHRYPDVRITGDRITVDRYPESGYADSRDYRAGPAGFGDPGYPEAGHGDRYSAAGYLGPGYSHARYPRSRYSGFGYTGSGHPDPGYPDPRHDPDSGHPGHGYPGSGDPGRGPEPGDPGVRGGGGWSGAEADGFRLPPVPDDDPWDDLGEYEPDPEDEPPGRRPLLAVLFPRREFRGHGEGGSRTSVSSAQRLGGLLLAGASVVGVAVYVPSILAADGRSFTGVVSNSGIAGLNFGASGRVGRVLVHLGQTVRKGEVLATEAGATRTAAVGADRAAITADKANLAALQADGSAAASIAAAQAQLAKDRARRAADQMKLAATRIVAPRRGTVVAIDGQPGEAVSPAG